MKALWLSQPVRLQRRDALLKRPFTMTVMPGWVGEPYLTLIRKAGKGSLLLKHPPEPAT